MGRREWIEQMRADMERGYHGERARTERLFSQLRSHGMEPSRSRNELEARYGQVWDQEEFERDFWIHFYLEGRPRIMVRRKCDVSRGLIYYQDSPRLYFGLSG